MVVNDPTTVASVWATAQFLDGTAMSGNEIGLNIAAGNVPNLVDLETRRLGAVIMNPVDGSLKVQNPFGIAIDHQDRIWIGNSGLSTVVRFPVSDPGSTGVSSAGRSWICHVPLCKVSPWLISFEYRQPSARSGAMTSIPRASPTAA